MRAVLVIAHAAAGVAGLGAGLAAMVPPGVNDRWAAVRNVYAGCIGTLLVALLTLIVVDWAGLSTVSRIAFVALAGLGVAMAWRLVLARRLTGGRPAGWAGRYVDHVYFTYISLWVGFLILPALSLPMPQVFVPLVALAVIATGHLVLRRVRPRLVGATDASAGGP